MPKGTKTIKELLQLYKETGVLPWSAGRRIEQNDATAVNNANLEAAKMPRMTDYERLLQNLALKLTYVGPDTRESSERQRAHRLAAQDRVIQREVAQREKNQEAFWNLVSLTSPSTYVGLAIGQKLEGPAALATDALTFGVNTMLSRGVGIIKNGIKKAIYSPSKTSAVIKDAANKFNPADVIDNDVAARYYLSGQKPPKVDFVYHGRKTYRGEPEDVLRNYSSRDVGLHVSPRRATAEQFANLYTVDPGVVYSGVDVKPPQLDFIAADLNNWNAGNWASELKRAKKIDKTTENLAYQSPFSIELVDGLYSKFSSVRDIVKHYGLDPDDIMTYGLVFDKYKVVGDEAGMEAANKEFAEYLSKNGVKFDYKNDFEGGGYIKPSRFISDPSDIWWDKVIYADPIIMNKPAIEIARDIPFIKNGTLIPGTEKVQKFSYSKRFLPILKDYKIWEPIINDR